jgi:hypothetical protein
MNPMQTHVKILAILHIVFGALGVLIGFGIFAFFGGIAGLIHMDHDPDAAIAVPMMGAIGAFVLILILCLSIPGIIAGIGLLSLQPWARILTIVLSSLDLVSFPFGTALGIYGLWALFAPDGVRLFDQRRVTSSV